VGDFFVFLFENFFVFLFENFFLQKILSISSSHAKNKKKQKEKLEDY